MENVINTSFVTTCENNFGTLKVPLSIIFGSINLLIGAISFFGNAVVFYVFYVNVNIRNRSSLCLMSLAFTDILVGAVLEPMYVTQILAPVTRSNCVLNSMRRFLSASLLGASMSSIALISYDRYIHLSKTTEYNNHMTKRKTLMLSVICWLLPAISPCLNKIRDGHGIFSAVIFVYTFLMLLVITTSYFLILRIVRRKQRQINEARSNNDSACYSRTDLRNDRNSMRVAKAIATIIICFIAFNSALLTYLGVVAYSSLSGRRPSWLTIEQFDIFYLITLTISMANSTINAPIYYLRIPGFKETMDRNMKRLFAFKPDFHVPSVSTPAQLRISGLAD